MIHARTHGPGGSYPRTVCGLPQSALPKGTRIGSLATLARLQSAGEPVCLDCLKEQNHAH